MDTHKQLAMRPQGITKVMIPATQYHREIGYFAIIIRGKQYMHTHNGASCPSDSCVYSMHVHVQIISKPHFSSIVLW